MNNYTISKKLLAALYASAIITVGFSERAEAWSPSSSSAGQSSSASSSFFVSSSNSPSSLSSSNSSISSSSSSSLSSSSSSSATGAGKIQTALLECFSQCQVAIDYTDLEGNPTNFGVAVRIDAIVTQKYCLFPMDEDGNVEYKLIYGSVCEAQLNSECYGRMTSLLEFVNHLGTPTKVPSAFAVQDITSSEISATTDPNSTCY